MQSLKELFRIGKGPSSSHTLGPSIAAEQFKLKHPDADRFIVELYGSLAATGKGHQTDKAIIDFMQPVEVEIVWKPEVTLQFHPNGLKFTAIDKDGQAIAEKTYYSVGGGAIREENQPAPASIYEHSTMDDILDYCNQHGLSFWEYVVQTEGPTIMDYLADVWNTMKAAIENGLNTEGVLPGGLGLSRKASNYYRKSKFSGDYARESGFVSSYALAAAEENAGGGIVVTAPTCGASGVIPATIRYVQEIMNCSDQIVLNALATAGLIGNLIKHNGSISGAEVGCQGEIGSACAMASGAVAQMMGGSIRQIEYAAEMGLEHFLGLTCDPIDGLVQIPCIERNAFAADRALFCANYALFTDGAHRVTLDTVISVMKQTGHDIPSLYRETSGGGLAEAYRTKKR